MGRLDQTIRSISPLLIGAILLQAIGCTSLKVVRDLSDCEDQPIYVTTNDGTRYTLDEWKTDSLGNIFGKGVAASATSSYIDLFEDTLKATTITKIQAHLPNTTATTLLIFGVLAVPLILWFIIANRIHQPLEHIRIFGNNGNINDI